jgi:hypothetical protein
VAAPAAEPGPLQRLPLAPGADAALAIGCEAQALWRRQTHGRSYWYASTELIGQQLLTARGLPTPAEAHALLAATP